MDTKAASALGRAALAHLEATDPGSLQQARQTGPHTFKYIKSQRFLAEYCWVVYASGFRVAVVQAKFPELEKAYKYFDLSSLNRMRSLRPALKVINNNLKATSFHRGAKAIAAEGFSPFKRRLAVEDVDALSQLPGIGPITKNHLAKNIGLADVAKEDIWLERAAASCDAASVSEFMAFLAPTLRESQHVVDIAIWQYGKDGKLKR